MIDEKNPDFADSPVARKRATFAYVPAERLNGLCLTIITPFYQAREEFQDTARSVLQQSLQPWEWLIINDGSTDPKSLSALNEYRRRDNRIHIIDLGQHVGVAAAFSQGMQRAETPYILLLESGDLLEATAAEKWLWFLSTHPGYSMVNSYQVGFGARESLWPHGYPAGEARTIEKALTATCLLRKEFFITAGDDERVVQVTPEEGDLRLPAAGKGIRGYTIPEFLCWRRCRIKTDESRKGREGEIEPDAFIEKLREYWFSPGEALSPPNKETALKTDSAVFSCQNRLNKKGKLRLLMILPWMTMGGADKFNLDLMEQLTGKGWEISIASTLDHPENSWYREFSRYTPDIFILPRFLSQYEHPSFLQYLLQSRQPDIVMISNSELGYLLLPYLRSQFPEAAYVDYCHGEEEEWKNGGYPAFSVRFQRYLDLSVVTSHHLKEWMLKRGAASEKVEVSYINIDSANWKPDKALKYQVRSQLNISGDMPVILYAGRLSAEKQPRLFAKVMRNLAKSGIQFTSLVAGDGEDRDWLEKYIHKYALADRVKILGSVPSARMRELMAAADIFFLPSRYEGIALTIYEAMSSGLAVVGADVGGQKELVDRDSGILLKTGNEKREIQDYSTVLMDLLKNPAACAAMGEKAHRRVEKYFRLELMGERMIQLFGKARQIHASRPSIDKYDEADPAYDRELSDYLRLFRQPDYSVSGVGGKLSPAEIPAELKTKLKNLFKQRRFKMALKLYGKTRRRAKVMDSGAAGERVEEETATDLQIKLMDLYKRRWFRMALGLFFKLRLNKIIFGG
jgi:glycosyltransferase involved in cell wall biosynthesis